ncbi:hypothetical protein N181_28550 [Sinorhizobium fredii USDA 205]|nr:Thivi_2564 family membrane protein [Sinorhizobium fredii]KSV81105.1 hypothetical protein N181_28550 [Sinorhizobium fredii USDA 205]
MSPAEAQRAAHLGADSPGAVFCAAPTPPFPLHNSAIFTPSLPERLSFQEDLGMPIIIGILITFLVIALVLYLVQKLPIDSTMKQMAQIVVVVVGVVSLLSSLDVF